MKSPCRISTVPSCRFRVASVVMTPVIVGILRNRVAKLLPSPCAIRNTPSSVASHAGFPCIAVKRRAVVRHQDGQFIPSLSVEELSILHSKVLTLEYLRIVRSSHRHVAQRGQNSQMPPRYGQQFRLEYKRRRRQSTQTMLTAQPISPHQLPRPSSTPRLGSSLARWPSPLLGDHVVCRNAIRRLNETRELGYGNCTCPRLETRLGCGGRDGLCQCCADCCGLQTPRGLRKYRPWPVTEWNVNNEAEAHTSKKGRCLLRQSVCRYVYPAWSWFSVFFFTVLARNKITNYTPCTSLHFSSPLCK